ncbi:hypothetical protein [Flintibacter muris]|uniref:hypothetical protein n=1 Tax=Flintibacter muris TaxID=2941327 RepID=UPI00203DEDFB|nr:hypothetical protein [Flintibacter muris]
MTKGDWLDLAVLERKKYNCLSEVMDLSRQMGEALDRSDDVSVRMLLALREDPLVQLQELKQAINMKKESLSPEDRERVSALGQGASPKGEEETTYHSQAGAARRLLERIVELDERLNRRLAGKNSFYEQKK